MPRAAAAKGFVRKQRERIKEINFEDVDINNIDIVDVTALKPQDDE